MVKAKKCCASGTCPSCDCCICICTKELKRALSPEALGLLKEVLT